MEPARDGPLSGKELALARAALLGWFARRPRGDLPWRRGPRDPYRVWAAEVLLQQTRAATAGPYYERFLARFPDLASLAAASEEEVLRVWQGAGYYGRARNFRRAAREVVERYGGRVPADPDAFASLPGVGAYTAGAVLSLAYDLPLPAVDGNVLRVLARLSAEEGVVDAPAVRRRITELARELHGVPLGPGSAAPGALNEALMDLGALICLPRRPDCGACPVAAWCRAREAGLAADLPRRRPRRAVPVVERSAAVGLDGMGRWCLVRRPPRGLLAGMWEFPTLEDLPLDDGARPLGSFTHTFTHRTWRVAVWLGRARQPLPPETSERRWLEPERLGELPVASLTRRIAAAAAERA